MNKKLIIIYAVVIGILGLAISFGGYCTWNALDPEFTCAQCHEIKPSFHKWKNSAHANVKCIDCHGTAISNGIHSLKEKTGMVISHITKDVKNSDIRLTEAQHLDIMNRCAKCHNAEFAQWKSGAHSTTYANIFEDPKHNSTEKPYWDCFRCHGMFYDGNINKLMELNGNDCTKWKIKDPKQRNIPTIPCMACHEIHTERAKLPDFKNYKESKTPQRDVPKTSLYSRADKMHFRTDKLTVLKQYLNGCEVSVSKDPNNTLCMNCHSPDWKRDVKTSDARTPVGVHEGFSCITCHNPHSNSAVESCVRCHDITQDKYKPKTGKCPQFIITPKHKK